MTTPARKTLLAWIEGRRHENRCSPPCGCCTVTAQFDPVASRIRGIPDLVKAMTERDCGGVLHRHPMIHNNRSVQCMADPSCEGTGKVSTPTHPLIRLALAAAMVCGQAGCDCKLGFLGNHDDKCRIVVDALHSVIYWLGRGRLPDIGNPRHARVKRRDDLWWKELAPMCHGHLVEDLFRGALYSAYRVLGSRLWEVLAREVRAWPS